METTQRRQSSKRTRYEHACQVQTDLIDLSLRCWVFFLLDVACGKKSSTFRVMEHLRRRVRALNFKEEDKRTFCDTIDHAQHMRMATTHGRGRGGGVEVLNGRFSSSLPSAATWRARPPAPPSCSQNLTPIIQTAKVPLSQKSCNSTHKPAGVRGQGRGPETHEARGPGIGVRWLRLLYDSRAAHRFVAGSGHGRVVACNGVWQCESESSG